MASPAELACFTAVTLLGLDNGSITPPNVVWMTESTDPAFATPQAAALCELGVLL